MLHLPKLVLCDLDGTLFRKKEGPGERHWFDWHRVHEDDHNPQVLLALRLFYNHGHRVGFLSGRPKEEGELPDGTKWNCETLTRRALANIHVPPYFLHMREAGDHRPDDVVKEELYRTHVEGVYDTDVILDDRDRVVGMWRGKLALQCWQVAPGNFG
jgi:hypothetical protein